MSPRGRKSPSKLLGNHQRCWLWGRNLVRETLAAGRWPIHELLLAEDLPELLLREMSSLAAEHGVVFRTVARQEVEHCCRSPEHQGFAAKMGPFPYANLEELQAQTGMRPRAALVLDGIQDSFNLGAILRSARAFGFDGVFLGERGQSPVNSQAARSSAGAINRIPIARCSDLPRLAADLQKRGLQIIAADSGGGLPIANCDLRGPVAIVIGNEGIGISPDLLAACNVRATIPIQAAVESLNAAAAAAVFCYELSRQRTPAQSPI